MSLLQSSPEEKDMQLRVDGEQTRELWLKRLTKASLDYITTKKKMEREKHEKCKLISEHCKCSSVTQGLFVHSQLFVF